MQGDTTSTLDYINLVIAVVGLMFGVAAIVWQLATWRLSGARIEVLLKHGALGGGGIALTWPPGAAATMNLTSQGFTHRVLAVEVINKGRMHAYVDSVAAELDNKVQFAHPHGLPANKPLPGFRLEPG